MQDMEVLHQQKKEKEEEALHRQPAVSRICHAVVTSALSAWHGFTNYHTIKYGLVLVCKYYRYTGDIFLKNEEIIGHVRNSVFTTFLHTI